MMKNINKTVVAISLFKLSDIILAQWRHPVASSKALDLLHWALHTVMYQHIIMAIKMASFVDIFFDCGLIVCYPGGCWGNWPPVASRRALDMLHWAMCFILHWQIAMAIKTANN
jgi:hypothetical protein